MRFTTLEDALNALCTGTLQLLDGPVGACVSPMGLRLTLQPVDYRFELHVCGHVEILVV